MSTYDNISLTRHHRCLPVVAVRVAEISYPPMNPLSPPPLRPGDDNEDDDPFGGTGDFTPLGGT